MIQTRIKKILVPMDGSATSFKALAQAIEIARTCQATILGINAISFLPAEFMPSVVPYKIYQKKEAGKFMEKAKLKAAKKGILFKYMIVYGNPVDQVINTAKSKKFDLIVIGARGKGRIAEVFLGSVSNAILHKSQIPVMIVK
ncbi:universal stress protein [Candidatus Nitrosotenuis uzonensis]|uniref:Universal stress protein n=1 Tax=Candidatus Nitrosotenuis uzonensis TaxID=1407055 RepID=V6AUZ3_9ARCH|nr:universal stress protein [Candidatus Nitrosotenuis uzonensis]CDI06380.1 Universal stress protein [Candidatus Nitrosotenuis uzonensis]